MYKVYETIWNITGSLTLYQVLYSTCLSMSILKQPIDRCEQIMRCSGRPRSTLPRSHHAHSIALWFRKKGSND